MKWKDACRHAACRGAVLSVMAMALPAQAIEWDGVVESPEAARLAAHAACLAHRDAVHGANTTDGQWQAMRQATRGGPLSVALLYHDGRKIAEGRTEAMERFVKAQVMKMARRD